MVCHAVIKAKGNMFLNRHSFLLVLMTLQQFRGHGIITDYKWHVMVRAHVLILKESWLSNTIWAGAGTFDRTSRMSADSKVLDKIEQEQSLTSQTPS